MQELSVIVPDPVFVYRTIAPVDLGYGADLSGAVPVFHSYRAFNNDFQASAHDSSVKTSYDAQVITSETQRQSFVGCDLNLTASYSFATGGVTASAGHSVDQATSDRRRTLFYAVRYSAEYKPRSIEADLTYTKEALGAQRSPAFEGTYGTHYVSSVTRQNVILAEYRFDSRSNWSQDDIRNNASLIASYLSGSAAARYNDSRDVRTFFQEVSVSLSVRAALAAQKSGLRALNSLVSVDGPDELERLTRALRRLLDHLDASDAPIVRVTLDAYPGINPISRAFSRYPIVSDLYGAWLASATCADACDSYTSVRRAWCDTAMLRALNTAKLAYDAMTLSIGKTGAQEVAGKPVHDNIIVDRKSLRVPTSSSELTSAVKLLTQSDTWDPPLLPKAEAIRWPSRPKNIMPDSLEITLDEVRYVGISGTPGEGGHPTNHGIRGSWTVQISGQPQPIDGPTFLLGPDQMSLSTIYPADRVLVGSIAGGHSLADATAVTLVGRLVIQEALQSYSCPGLGISRHELLDGLAQSPDGLYTVSTRTCDWRGVAQVMMIFTLRAIDTPLVTMPTT